MSIDDWFADRRNGSLGDAMDDEVVERIPLVEIPPEFADEPLRHRPQDDPDGLRRRNGLPAQRRAPGGGPRPTRAQPAASSSPGTTGAGLPWHLRDRILDAARTTRGTDTKAIVTLLRLRGADVTPEQVAEVLRTLTTPDRALVHRRLTAVQRESRLVPRQLGRPQPQRTVNADSRPRHARRPVPTPETCPACSVHVLDRGLCGCS